MLVYIRLLAYYLGLLLALPPRLLANLLSMSNLGAWCAGKNIEDSGLNCDGKRHVGGRRFVYSVPGIRVASLGWLSIEMMRMKRRARLYEGNNGQRKAIATPKDTET